MRVVNELKWEFDCNYCGKKFGNDPIKAALHMGKRCKVLKK